QMVVSAIASTPHSNLSPKALWAYISPRIADRVTDGGRNLLSFNWPSYRAHAGGVAA
ncbi:TPA: hypothetical protein ACSO5R_005697, partial [Escherichia coli]